MASLRERIRSHLPGLAPDAIVDLQSLFPNPGEISPPPTAHSRIPMDEPINLVNLMDVIIYNLFKSDAKLTMATWRAFFLFEDHYGGENAAGDRWRERSFEILYVVSKVDMVEYTATVEISFDVYFKTTLRSLEDIVGRTSGAAVANPEKVRKGKGFLKSTPIIVAFSRCLSNVLRGHDLEKAINDERLRSIIDEMGIYVVDNLGMLRGVVVKDGVVLDLRRLNQLQSNTTKYEANYFTQLVHEAAHYVVRRFVNDFAFTSPIKYDEAGEKIYDPIIGSKGLELGRYIEILLFGYQPDWMNCTRLGAYLFRRRAFSTSRSSLPLFSRVERAILLKKRMVGSISMAGDFSGSVPDLLDWPNYCLC